MAALFLSPAWANHEETGTPHAEWNTLDPNPIWCPTGDVNVPSPAENTLSNCQATHPYCVAHGPAKTCANTGRNAPHSGPIYYRTQDPCPPDHSWNPTTMQCVDSGCTSGDKWNIEGTGSVPTGNVCNATTNCEVQPTFIAGGSGSWWGVGESTGANCSSQPNYDGAPSPLTEEPDLPQCQDVEGVYTCGPSEEEGVCGKINGESVCTSTTPGCGIMNGVEICADDEKNCGEVNGRPVCMAHQDGSGPAGSPNWCMVDAQANVVCYNGNVRETTTETTVDNGDGTTTTTKTTDTNIRGRGTTVEVTTQPGGTAGTTTTTRNIAGLAADATEVRGEVGVSGPVEIDDSGIGSADGVHDGANSDIQVSYDARTAEINSVDGIVVDTFTPFTSWSFGGAACQPFTMGDTIGGTFTLDYCSHWEPFREFMAWVLYILTAWYISMIWARARAR